MLRLAKAVLDIALWRQSPAQLPASTFLLGLVVAVAALVEVADALLLTRGQGPILIRVAITIVVPLVFTWVVLRIARYPQRYLQTCVAFLGVAVLAQLASSPLDSLVKVVGPDKPAALPFALLGLVVLVWYLLACANIWRAALESTLALGGAISVGYLLLNVALAQQFLHGI